MSRKGAIIMGSIFLVGRMALCVLFIVISLSLDPRELPRNSYFSIIPPIYWAIGFGIGALSDLVLVLGAWKKNIGAIYTWCVAQIFFGGLVCCILIPLVAMKAVREIKDEKEGLPTTQTQYPQKTQFQYNVYANPIQSETS
jgi:hypothetical protein